MVTHDANAVALSPERVKGFNVVSRFYPEITIDYFTHVSDTIQFYFTVKALYPKFGAPRVLDYGAGRGAWTEEQKSVALRKLHDLRDGASEVVAADVDPAVLQNTCSHKQMMIQPGQALPFDDASFDIIVSDYVFEHVQEPAPVVRELLRVLRPGGWIAARTPSKHGYVAWAARLVPNRLHIALLNYIQPGRKAIDVFPTAYKMNSHDLAGSLRDSE